ncbi:MAG: site-specific integrase [Thermoanaerobaculia bacterium]|nr:site-specific integrase [Thermoanaerobaculia bacterium]
MRGQVPGLSWDPKTKRGTVVVWLREAGGKRRKHRFAAASEGQARAIARKFIDGVHREQILAGTAPATAPPTAPAAGPSITFEVFFASHLGRFLEGKRPATAEFYRAVRIAVERDGVLVRTALEALRKADIEDFMLRLEKRGRASTTAANYGAAVVALVRWAVDRDLVAEFPIKKRIHYPKREKPELELSPKEEQSLLSAFDERVFQQAVETNPGLRGFRFDPFAFTRLQAFHPLLLAGMRTGLRKGDLLRLKWKQVNLDEGWIEVMTAKKNVPVALGITPDLHAALSRCHHCADPDGLVFLRPDDEPWTIQSVKDVFNLAKRVAGITRRLRFHDATRHTLGSTLVTAGMTLEEVAVVLGHRDFRSTARYARVRSEAVRQKFLNAMEKRAAR